MTIRVFFVLPKDGNESESSKVMREAYEAAVTYEINVQWIQETETNIEFLKTDYFVFESFEGEFYKKVLQSKSVRIISPLCLKQCIRSMKAIPNTETPLFSLAMENCIVACSCLPKEGKREVKFKVQAMAGIFTPDLVSDATHLVTDGVKSEKYNIAVSRGIKIMAVEFIDALWEASKTRLVHASDEEFDAFKCPVFQKLNICSTGFTKNETEVERLVEQNGGNFSSSMHPAKTDILVCKSSASTSSAKYKSAIKAKIDCVTKNWILDSVEKGYALPNVQDYAVSKASTSTPTKQDNFVDPNFSQMSCIHPTVSQSETLMSKVIEQTVNQSCFVGNNGKSPDSLIDSIDIKKVKSSGLFLDGCVIFLAGFKTEQSEKLCKILNFSGAISCFTLNDRITHAIIGNPKCHELKTISNKKLSCAVVNVNWLIDSMNEKMPVDVEKYLILDENNSSQSPILAETSSPLSKKGLNFLRSNVTILEDERDKTIPEIGTIVENPQDDDVVQKYLTSTQTKDSMDDALAAFTMNPDPSIATISKSSSKDNSNEINENNPSPNFQNASKTTANNTQLESPSVNATETTITSLFVDLKFIILDFTDEEEAVIENGIKSQQGVVVNKNFKGVADYAVVPITHMSTTCVIATHVVNYLWVADCIDSRKLIADIEYFHRPFPTQPKAAEALQGLCISVSGLGKHEKEFLSAVIRQLGGVQQDYMSRYTNEEMKTLASTHLILNEPTGKKYQGAIKWGLPVVTKEWLLKCAEEGRKVNEYDFIIGENKESFRVSRISCTPVRKRLLEDEVCQTPSNMAAPCSQITPVNEIMARVRKMCGGLDTPGAQVGTPETPTGNNSLDEMTTPETPYGAVFQNPPPPAMRKKWKRWVMSMPTLYKSPSTPLSELKRQFYRKHNLLRDETPPQRDLREDFSELFDGNENKDSNNQQDGVEPIEMMDVDEAGSESEKRMNEIAIGQIEELETHLQSSTRKSSRRQSVVRVESEAGTIPERETQPGSVGWDAFMEIPSAILDNAHQPAQKAKHFMISGVDNISERQDLTEEVEGLGATHSMLHNFDPLATHLLCDKLNRNEKLFASMASGLWVLHVSYVRDSAAAGKWLDEEDYEFGNPEVIHKFKLTDEGRQKAVAARNWRQRIASRGYGAFHDFRAIVLSNRRDAMVRVLQAGGAMIVDASPPFDEDISATHCLLDVKSHNVAQFIPLVKQGIICISPLYVNDFLQEQAFSVNKFIIPALEKYYDS